MVAFLGVSRHMVLAIGDGINSPSATLDTPHLRQDILQATGINAHY